MPFVFLSPSTQEWNSYINGGNEELQMNLIADAMEPYLRSSGITFTRNDRERDVRGAIADSNARNYDVHLALHSNAGEGRFAGVLTGPDIYFSPYSSQSEKLAAITANNLKSIYPDPSKVDILPTTSLGEVQRTRAVAILAELGYHDNKGDADWLKANTEAIARNLVMSLCDYFGIPFIESVPPRNGRVVTDGSNLNIRSFPSMNGSIIGSAPDRADIKILGRTGNWYVVSYGGITGYSSADYIEV